MNPAGNYRRLSLRDHIYTYGDTYVGNTQKVEDVPMFVYNGESDTVEKRECSYVPALLKIFDEILTNATDHCTRSADSETPVKEISVDIDPETHEISIYNDGPGIPVETHESEKDDDGKPIMKPTLIFFHLLTSGNYREIGDEIELTVGGRNGLGAKLTAIYSKMFKVETADGSKLFTQVSHDNLTRIDPAKVVAKKRKAGYTRISFLPDYKRFGIDEGLTDDIRSLFEKRVIDAAAWTPPTVSVKLNGRKLPTKSFENYADMFLGKRGEGDRLPRVYMNPHPRWEIVVAPSRVHSGGYAGVSMVNGVCTTSGGTHEDYVASQIVSGYIEIAKKRNKNISIRPNHVKDNIFVMIKSTIVNPTFDSQTKERMTSPVKNWGSKPTLSPEDHEKIYKTLGIIDRVVGLAALQEDKDAKKTDGKKKSRINVPGLDDAHDAGTANSAKCTLIITEGLSAKATAVAGVSSIKDGKRFYGIFPIRGKLMNCLDATLAKQNDNAEIQALKKIMGLEHGRDYSKDTSNLRYGSVRIMADADHDGSHIRGLVAAFFWSRWPSLMRLEKPFLSSLLSPIIKATRGSTVHEFYNVGDFKVWCNENDASRYTIKYFKGLGTSDRKDAISIMEKNIYQDYLFDDESDDLLDMAFRKTRAGDRKTWLRAIDHENTLDNNQRRVYFKDFVNKELIFYAERSVERALPNVVDGMKESIRKILFACLKRNLFKNEIKVAQLAANVSEVSGYRHGEASLVSAIVGMAQKFKNNAPLLEDRGQFGTRLQGGDDAAQSRYIYTVLRDYVAKLFRSEDRDPEIIDYIVEDGHSVEPRFYHPVLPFALISGDIGLATAFSTEIPAYNPEDIANIVTRMCDVAGNHDETDIGVSQAACRVRDMDLDDPVPWCAGFRGEIRPAKSGRGYESVGILKKKAGGGSAATSGTKWEITELPIGVWTEPYKLFLDSLVDSGKLKSYVDGGTDQVVGFELVASPEFTPTLENMKLVSTDKLSTSNMHLFSADRKIKKYDTTIDIVKDYFPERLRQYLLRKQRRIVVLEEGLVKLKTKHRYVSEIVADDLKVMRRKGEDICADLKARGYPELDVGYKFLRSMPIESLDEDNVQALATSIAKEDAKLEDVKSTHIVDIWRREIDEFMESWKSYHSSYLESMK